MSSLYVKPSRPSTPIIASPSSRSIPHTTPRTAKRSKRLHILRTLYRNSAKSFILGDFGTTAAYLNEANQIEKGDRGAWLTFLEREREEYEEEEDQSRTTKQLEDEIESRRKLDILRITFLATVKSIAEGEEEGETVLSGLPEEMGELLKLRGDELITRLWFDSIGLDGMATNDIFPSPEASELHPSIAIALVLGALKMQQPKQARAIAEAWFGSTSESLDLLLLETSSTLDLAMGFTLESSMISGSVLKEKLEPKAAVVGSWIKLMDLLSLHVLPQLGEWEAAGDFIRLQGVENGGWIPDERVQDGLSRLHQLQLDETALIDSKIQRKKELELSKAEKSKEKERDRRRVEKGKGRSKGSTSPIAVSSAPLPAGATTNLNGEVTDVAQAGIVTTSSNGSTFTSLRSTLSSYLTRTSTLSTPITTPATLNFSQLISSPSAIINYLRHHALTDPLRFVSLIFTLFAISSWLRSKLILRKSAATASKGSKLIGIKDMFKFGFSSIGQTIKMATKVTSL